MLAAPNLGGSVTTHHFTESRAIDMLTPPKVEQYVPSPRLRPLPNGVAWSAGPLAECDFSLESDDCYIAVGIDG